MKSREKILSLKFKDHNTNAAYTIVEFLMVLVIIGVIATFVIPNLSYQSGNNNSKIAEGLKSDVSKAFELSATSSGLIQKSDSPSAVVVRALHTTNAQSINHSGTLLIDYTTPIGWHIQVPTSWENADGTHLSDYAAIELVDTNGQNEGSITVYRENATSSSKNIAQVNPISLTPSNAVSVSSKSVAPVIPNEAVIDAKPYYIWVATVTVTNTEEDNQGVSGINVISSNPECGSGTTNAHGVVLIPRACHQLSQITAAAR